MSDLKMIVDPEPIETVDPSKAKLPVLASDAALNRRDLDIMKRDLITVKKDYAEIRENMVILTHQYSHTPGRPFFIVFGLAWLCMLAAIVTFQPQLTALVSRLIALALHR